MNKDKCNKNYLNYQVNSAQGKARLNFHHPVMVRYYRGNFHRLCFASWAVRSKIVEHLDLVLVNPGVVQSGKYYSHFPDGLSVSS